MARNVKKMVPHGAKKPPAKSASVKPKPVSRPDPEVFSLTRYRAKYPDVVVAVSRGEFTKYYVLGALAHEETRAAFKGCGGVSVARDLDAVISDFSSAVADVVAKRQAALAAAAEAEYTVTIHDGVGVMGSVLETRKRVGRAAWKVYERYQAAGSGCRVPPRSDAVVVTKAEHKLIVDAWRRSEARRREVIEVRHAADQKIADDEESQLRSAVNLILKRVAAAAATKKE